MRIIAFLMAIALAACSQPPKPMLARTVKRYDCDGFFYAPASEIRPYTVAP